MSTQTTFADLCKQSTPTKLRWMIPALIGVKRSTFDRWSNKGAPAKRSKKYDAAIEELRALAEIYKSGTLDNHIYKLVRG